MDRFYTNRKLLRDIGSFVTDLVPDGYTFVDFSCGDNYFCRECIPSVNSIGYDIMPKDDTTVTRADWLTVQHLPKNLVIGLNPPFGYQGSMAKKFVKKALSFDPYALVLILPLVKFDVPSYEVIHERILPKDSFIDPDTQKPFSEIGAKFVVYRKSDTPRGNPTRDNANLEVPGVTFSRKWKDEWQNCLVIRRVGRRTTKQFYMMTSLTSVWYIDFGSTECTAVDTPRHKIAGDCWLKVYFTTDVGIETLKRIAETIFASPEVGYDQHHPHVITNDYIRNVVANVVQ